MSTTTVEPLTLTAQDRCDRCGAAALARAGKEEAELLFCNHHLIENKQKLEDLGWTIEVVPSTP